MVIRKKKKRQSFEQYLEELKTRGYSSLEAMTISLKKYPYKIPEQIREKINKVYSTERKASKKKNPVDASAYKQWIKLSYRQQKDLLESIDEMRPYNNDDKIKDALVRFFGISWNLADHALKVYSKMKKNPAHRPLMYFVCRNIGKKAEVKTARIQMDYKRLYQKYDEVYGPFSSMKEAKREVDSLNMDKNPMYPGETKEWKKIVRATAKSLKDQGYSRSKALKAIRKQLKGDISSSLIRSAINIIYGKKNPRLKKRLVDKGVKGYRAVLKREEELKKDLAFLDKVAVREARHTGKPASDTIRKMLRIIAKLSNIEKIKKKKYTR